MMSVDTRLSNNNETLTVSISGDFNFSLLNEFRGAYNSKEAMAAKDIIVDMEKTLTVDSSALGMLLNMQRHLEKADGDVIIINCNEVVAKIFKITNFEKKFTIEE